MAHNADLERIIGAPQFESSVAPWRDMERFIGTRLPDDYKRTFDMYPRLEFDGFLGAFHPGLDAEQYVERCRRVLDPLRQLILEQGAIRSIDDSGQVQSMSPYPLFPEVGGLLHWGGTQNGDMCLWLTSDSDPNQWPVVVTDHRDYWRYDGGFAAFLVGVMQQTIRCPIFPKTFPHEMRVDQFEVHG